MNNNLYAKDLKRNFKKFLIWTVSVMSLNIFTAFMYDSIQAGTDQVQLLLELYPESLMKAFGMDAVSWSNILGFYATYFIFYILLSGGVFSITFGMDILSKEESKRTAEFLYTRPLTRSEVYVTKTLSLLTYIFLFNLMSYLGAWVTLYAMNGSELSVRNLTILHAAGLLFCFMFCGIGLLVAAIIKRGKTSLFAGIGVIMLMYFYDAIMKTTDYYDTLGYITPYRFVPMDVTSTGYGIGAGQLAYFLAIGTVTIAAGYLIFRKKDIYV